MENLRRKLTRDIQRYSFLRHNIANPTLVAVLDEMIAEANTQLAALDAQSRTTPSYGSSGRIHPGTAGLTEFLHFGDWGLDPQSKSATMPTGKQVELTRGEFELLFTFLTHANQILTRQVLMQMWQSRAAAPGERTVDVLVNRLRRKLEADPRHPKNIITVRNEGYLFRSRGIAWSNPPRSRGAF